MALRANRPGTRPETRQGMRQGARPGMRQGMRLPMRVWDAPVRLFHWAIVLLVAALYASIGAGAMRLHLLAGYAVLALLLFRLVWGLVGSETARFSMLLRNPLAGLRHLARFGGREPDNQVGYSELGGWVALLILLLLLAGVVTGLSAHDGGATEGPLVKHLGKAASDRLTAWHDGPLQIALLVVIGLHALAIAAYAVVKRQNLLRPMITGKKMLPAATRAPRMAPAALAWFILALAAVAAWLIATRA